MARPQTGDDIDDKPLDPAVEKVRRKLVRFVAINLGLLFVAVMVVVGAVVYKTATAEPPVRSGGDMSPEGVIEAEIDLPAGAAIVSHAISGNRLSIDAELADGSRTIFIYDLAERRVVGRLAVKTR